MKTGTKLITLELGTYEIQAFVFKDKHFHHKYKDLKHVKKMHKIMEKYEYFKKHKHHNYHHAHLQYAVISTTITVLPVDPCDNVLGDGSESNPYQANNMTQLSCMYGLGYVWNSANHIKLGFDIDLLGKQQWFGYWSASLDGDGHTISWDASLSCDGNQNGVVNESDDYGYDARSTI